MAISNYTEGQRFFQEDETVFVDRSIKYPVSVKALRACRSWLNTVTVEKNAQLTKCTVQSLVVGGDLNAHSCNLTTVDVDGKASLYNCYQMDSITANDDIKLINKTGKIFTKWIETQKSVDIKNMHIDELIFRSGHSIIDNCDISCIRIKRPERTEQECILEFKGASTVGKIISEGVDVEIRGKKLEL